MGEDGQGMAGKGQAESPPEQVTDLSRPLAVAQQRDMKLLYSEVVQGWGWAGDGHSKDSPFPGQGQLPFLGFSALEGHSLWPYGIQAMCGRRSLRSEDLWADLSSNSSHSAIKAIKAPVQKWESGERLEGGGGGVGVLG